MKNYTCQQEQRRRTIDANPKSSQQVSFSKALQMFQGVRPEFLIQREVNPLTEQSAREEFKTFIRERDFDGINEQSLDKKIILAIRETGPDSVIRLEEGKAKPKPHSISSKSVKPKSIGDQTQIDDIQRLKKVGGVPIKDIEGFVGYWGEGKICGKLEGLTTTFGGTDNNQIAGQIEQLADEEIGILDDMKKKAQGVKQAPADFLKYFGSDATNQRHLKLENIEPVKESLPHVWEEFLYTGDYDIHEMYNVGGERITDGEQQAEILNGLNTATGAEGSIIAKDRSVLLEGAPNNALFQHGAQSEYAEFFAAEKEEKIRMMEGKVSEDELQRIQEKEPDPGLLKSDSGKLAWFNKGVNWWKSNDLAEHIQVREKLNLNAPQRDTWVTV